MDVAVPWLQRADLHEPPQYKTKEAAGCDLACDFPHIEIPPNAYMPIPTGVQIAIPPGYFGLMKERSSIGKMGCFILAGIIDSDYRGELLMLLRNSSSNFVRFNRGDRIANLIILPYVRATFFPNTALPASDRGEAGFGSTGKN